MERDVRVPCVQTFTFQPDMRGTIATSPRIVLLQHPRPDGPLLGYYGGEPIAAAVVDDFGRRYVYAGVGPRRRDGRLDEDLLEPGEWLTESGLIYRWDGEKRHKP